MTATIKTKSTAFRSEMEPVRSQLQAWRQTRKRGEHIPETLWRALGELARGFGVGRVSKALGVGYHALKERTREPTQSAGGGNDSAAFVELPMPGAAARSHWVVELEDGRGAKMTLRLGSGSGSEVLSLVQAFWSRQP
jgi:hypothetical protein